MCSAWSGCASSLTKLTISWSACAIEAASEGERWRIESKSGPSHGRSGVGSRREPVAGNEGDGQVCVKRIRPQCPGGSHPASSPVGAEAAVQGACEEAGARRRRGAAGVGRDPEEVPVPERCAEDAEVDPLLSSSGSFESGFFNAIVASRLTSQSPAPMGPAAVALTARKPSDALALTS